MAILEMEEFLDQCKRSGDEAYAAFKVLLERLRNPATRSAARIFLARLQKRFGDKEASAECFRIYHFRIHDVFLAVYEGYDRREKLTMLEIPSIFIPEDWSFTFYEGINRHPDAIFKEKTVAELGCGNGWISIALAAKWLPSKVYGLDINPRAIKVAWINLYLNALDENGNYIYDQEGKTLLDRVEFHESDLLGYCRDNNMELDRVVGCIPQILNPNPEAMSKLITENASEDFLYSLSNYCALQGFVEDQFGLGLIARAVEEGISIIKPMGFMIFNIGGRPGQGVCRRLFERRGFRITKLWQTKVLQAADTDISALVEIEKNSPHRFEFFMGLVGDQPISARTALAYVRSGGRISHSLSVYSCQLRNPGQVRAIFDFLKDDGFKEISSSLDLSFEDEAVAEEKIPFLAQLAGILKSSPFLLAEPPAGSIRFRNLIAGFLKMYHHIPLTSENVVVFPSRSTAIENVLRLFLPPLAIVDENLTKQLPKQWLTATGAKGAREGDVMVIEAPRQSDLMIELIRTLKPQVVVTGMASFEAITSSAFEHLLSATSLVGARLFLDLSDHLELSSLPPSNGVLNFLASHVLPPHAALLCSLLKNKVYSDLEVTFVISEEIATVNALAKTMELLAGHTPLLSQFYYGCLLSELLAFQIPDRHPSLQREASTPSPALTIPLAGAVASVLAGVEPTVNHSLIPVPPAVRVTVFEGFVRQNLSEPEADVRPGILSHLGRALGLAATPEFFFSGTTPLTLFSRLALCCARHGGTLCFPAGSPGNYISAAQLLGAATATIPTRPDDGFKLATSDLATTLSRITSPWVYLSAPTSSPAGAVYTRREIRSLVAASAAAGARSIILDMSFSGLEFDDNVEEDGEKWSLKEAGELAVVVLGGLSLELLTGGLDFGFLVLDDPVLADAFASFHQGQSGPHSTLRYAFKKLLALKAASSNPLQSAVLQQKSLLYRRSLRLTQVLTECGWEVAPCAGGVTLMARPKAHLGRRVALEDGSVAVVDEGSVRDVVTRATGLQVNSGVWTGVPGYCSFSLAMQDDGFEKVILSLRSFHRLIVA